MRPVDQRYPADPRRRDGRTTDGRLGDCLRACIATVLACEYDEVPHFAEHGPSWFDNWRRWTRMFAGCDVGTLTPAHGTLRPYLPDPNPGVIGIGVGPSPRAPLRRRHAVVVDLDLRLLHDPHPSRAGLAAVDEVHLLVPIYWPGPARPAELTALAADPAPPARLQPTH